MVLLCCSGFSSRNTASPSMVSSHFLGYSELICSQCLGTVPKWVLCRCWFAGLDFSTGSLKRRNVKC